MGCRVWRCAAPRHSGQQFLPHGRMAGRRISADQARRAPYVSRQRIGRVHVTGSTKGIARKLISQDQKRQRAFWRSNPVVTPPFGDLHMQVQEAFPELVVEAFVFVEPPAFIPGLLPEVHSMRDLPGISMLLLPGVGEHDEAYDCAVRAYILTVKAEGGRRRESATRIWSGARTGWTPYAIAHETLWTSPLSLRYTYCQYRANASIVFIVSFRKHPIASLVRLVCSLVVRCSCRFCIAKYLN